MAGSTMTGISNVDLSKILSVAGPGSAIKLQSPSCIFGFSNFKNMEYVQTACKKNSIDNEYLQTSNN